MAELIKKAVLLAFAITSFSLYAEDKLGTEDVIKLLDSGMRQPLIIEIVKSTPAAYDLSPAAVAKLRHHGALQPLLDAMKSRSAATASADFALPNVSPLLARIPSNIPAEEALRARASAMEGETCRDDIFSTEDCHASHPTGCTDSATPGYDAYLNFIKNRMPSPTAPATVVLSEQRLQSLENELPETLTTRNHGQHAGELAANDEEGKLVTVVGTVFYAYHGGKETCNCNMTGSEDALDFHIAVGFTDFPASNDALQKLRSGNIRDDFTMKQVLSATDVDKLQKTSFIVEMTPYFRFKHPELHWTLDNVQKATGRKVRVTGQLMVDNAHHSRGDDCGMDGHTAHCWRSTIWEIHPVSQFEVCTGNTCSASSNDWVALKDF